MSGAAGRPPATSSSPRRRLAGLADLVAALAVVAVVLARVAPSRSLSGDSDWLLAVLVLLTAIQIDPRELSQLRGRLPAVAGLAVGVLLADTALAWIVSRPFSGATREGILSLGLASTEVASVGLIALAGGETVLALGVLTASLVASAILGPLLAGVLAHTTGHGGSLAVLGRFALVVLLPLALGLVVRGARPQLRRIEAEANGVSALAVCALLYAAVSGVSSGHALLTELLGGAIFLVVAAGFGALLARGAGARARAHAHARAPAFDATVIVFTTTLRDFAVAATLAREAFGSAAAGVGGVYGALMLLTGALAATVLRRRSARAHRPPPAAPYGE